MSAGLELAPLKLITHHIPIAYWSLLKAQTLSRTEVQSSNHCFVSPFWLFLVEVMAGNSQISGGLNAKQNSTSDPFGIIWEDIEEKQKNPHVERNINIKPKK